jgi:hypothetical protein
VKLRRHTTRWIALACALAALPLLLLAIDGGFGQDGPGEPNGAGSPEALGQGAWSWFADPRAVTYRGSTYVGWLDPTGRVVVSAYDGKRRTETLLAREPASDDHDNPALLTLEDGRLMIFYSHHDGGPMHYRTTLRPGDITAFGPERILHTNVDAPPHKGWTYPNPVRLSAEGNRVFLFWRAANWNPAYSTRRPGGRWAPARVFIRVPGERPYLKVDTNGRDAMYFAFTESHPLEVDGGGIYFVRYRRGSFYGAGARRIRSLARLPLRLSDADVVYRPQPGESSAWVHDVAVGTRRRPTIVYVVFPSKGDHVYRYAQWNGRRWVNHTITHAGGSITEVKRERYYSGGITLDHRDPSIVYLSRQVDGGHRLERWQTPDGGRTWRRRTLASPSPGVANVRPVVPRGPHAPGEVVWLRGRYVSYTEFYTRIFTSRGRAGHEPPTAAFEVAQAPGGVLRFERKAAAPGVSARWSFGDGATARGDAPRHRYERPGTYFPRLTVTDGSGRRDVLAREIVVR